MAWAWSQRLKPAHAKLVLMAICETTDVDGWTVIDFKNLAGMCALSPERVESIVLQLVEMGLITRDQSWRGSNQRFRGVGPRHVDPNQQALALSV